MPTVTYTNTTAPPETWTAYDNTAPAGLESIHFIPEVWTADVLAQQQLWEQAERRYHMMTDGTIKEVVDKPKKKGKRLKYEF